MSNNSFATKAFGGEMELAPAALGSSGPSAMSWPFAHHTTVATGRTGIKLILQALRPRLTGPFLLPAYLCPSVLQPFREEGVQVRFYPVKTDLTLDLDDLKRQVDLVRPEGLLFIHYLGFPVSAAAAGFFHEITKQCWVIEDCAQGSLVEPDDPPVGRIGSFAITSFRKYLPVPDGGLVINRTDVSLPSLPLADGPFVQYRALGKWLRHVFFEGGLDRHVIEEAALALFQAAEDDLDARVPMQAMSRISATLLGAVDLREAMACRRRNYTFLLKAFAHDRQLCSIGQPVLPGLPDSASPLVFAVRVAGGLRDRLRQELIAQRVYCPIHWRLPAEVKGDTFPEAHRLANEILGLPMDQRYDEADMEKLIERLKRAWKKVASAECGATGLTRSFQN